MIYHWALYFCLFLALWSALIAGVFSAFSEFVMAALSQTTPAGAIESMQQINRKVIKTQFVVGIVAIAAFSILFLMYSIKAFDGTAVKTIALACLVYIPSVFLMTVFGNVPMNNKLQQYDHTTQEAQTYWTYYVKSWTRFNHVRSIGSILTAGLYVVAAITLITSGQV
ncbi:MAG: DUF1772 domain-containing protein [Gammaproteobacteria bacterium]|nr:DUF1772 domain-containing protein [Gammaproteobacteria bacterium]